MYRNPLGTLWLSIKSISKYALARSSVLSEAMAREKPRSCVSWQAFISPPPGKCRCQTVNQWIQCDNRSVLSQNRQDCIRGSLLGKTFDTIRECMASQTRTLGREPPNSQNILTCWTALAGIPKASVAACGKKLHCYVHWLTGPLFCCWTNRRLGSTSRAQGPSDTSLNS